MINRGIVINAGGSCYFMNAYVCVRMLRHLGCELPVQFWYRDVSEFHPAMARAVEGIGVTFQSVAEMRKLHPMRASGGWEQKPYSILHSPFDQVLLLDADIIAVSDPTFLFDSEAFNAHGSLWWPDSRSLPADHPIWDVCGLEPDTGPGFQGGQQMVDKTRCSKALLLAVEMNEDSDVYYKLVYGEQDIYRLAWKLTGTPYTLIETAPQFLAQTILEHAPDGTRLFQHRCNDKWNFVRNQNIPDFWYESQCFEFIRELREFFPDWVEIAERDAANNPREFLCPHVPHVDWKQAILAAFEEARANWKQGGVTMVGV